MLVGRLDSTEGKVWSTKFVIPELPTGSRPSIFRSPCLPFTIWFYSWLTYTHRTDGVICSCRLVLATTNYSPSVFSGWTDATSSLLAVIYSLVMWSEKALTTFPSSFVTLELLEESALAIVLDQSPSSNTLPFDSIDELIFKKVNGSLDFVAYVC